MSKNPLAWMLASALLAAPLAMAQTDSPNTRISDVSESEDPFLWLEDVDGERALDWVRERNERTTSHFEATDGFNRLREDLLAILDSDDRIPYVSKLGDHYYNFWRDQNNVRGVWRRTTLEQYRGGNTQWEVVIDLDALAEAEGENWVWAGASCLRPAYERCLVNLSRGGADATVTREFDVPSRAFVEGGFQRPEAKGGMGWIDADTVYVFTDFGEGSMTESGYPRTVRQWRRGTPMEQAEGIFEGRPEDMYIAAFRDNTPGFERDFVSRTIAFYNNEIYHRTGDGRLVKVDAPNSANKGAFRDYLYLELRQPWEVGGRTYAAGSLLLAKFDDFMAGGRDFEVLFEPTETTSLAGFGALRDHLFLNVLDDVNNRIYVLTPGEDGWRREPLVGAPDFGTVGISAIDANESNAFFMTVTDFITPTTLYIGEIGSEPEKLRQLPDFFDASGLAISQHFATSADGTRVPYFLVAREDIALDGDTPTLLYGYGGFEISLTPSYSAAAGRAWTSQGGAYVVANIRGGGEYGPRWHQAALRENRMRAYEDFAAVAEDLIERGVTRPERLGIQGGSNGGLLIGNMITHWPQLFGAAVIQVPLLDMKRYHRLLAGASWMAEYGNPDIPEEWAFIRTFSAYQNLREGVTYPPTLFTTSTRDDRVHPGHARKMMARMEAMGQDVTYYENIEGGHGGAANNRQAAHMQALAYSFLYERLFHGRAD